MVLDHFRYNLRTSDQLAKMLAVTRLHPRQCKQLTKLRHTQTLNELQRGMTFSVDFDSTQKTILLKQNTLTSS